MQKKLLFMEDLVNFFLNSNVNKFSSSDYGYKISVQIPATFEIVDSVDNDHRGMMRLKFRIFHLNLNRNGSYVSEDAAKDAMTTIKDRPVMAYIHQLDNGEWDFESHNVSLKEDEDGNEVFEYEEKQVGSFSQEEPFFEYDKELDKTFVCAYAYISEQYTKACDIIRRKGGTKNSVELVIEELSFNAKEKYLELKKFYVSASTLLGCYSDGTEVAEGMLGSRADIIEFSINNNSILNRAELIDEITQAVMDRLDNHIAKEFANDNQRKEECALEQNISEMTENLEVNNFDEEATEEETPEVVDTEQMSEETEENEDSGSENDSVEIRTESAEESQEEEQEEDSSDESAFSVEYSVKFNGVVKTYSSSLMEKLNALYELVNSTYGEADNTWYDIDAYDEEKLVIMHDYWNGRHYRQSYSVKGDKYSLKGDRTQVYCTWLSEDEQKQLESMKSNYSIISEKLIKYEEEPEKMKVLDSTEYTLISEKEEFINFKKPENHFDLSIDKVRQKANDMLLQFAKSGQLNFSTETKKDNIKGTPKKTYAYGTYERNTNYLDSLLKR